MKSSYVKAFCKLIIFFTADQEIISYISIDFHNTLLQDSSFDIHIIKEIYPYFLCWLQNQGKT